MDSRASLASQESTAQMKMMSRKRPLHTCAVSVLVIANKANTIVQGIHGPLGVIAKVTAKFATFASPIIFLKQYQWIMMAILSFVDNQILAVESLIERAYPPSTVVFNKIDDLVGVTESLPGKFDEAMNKLPSSMHQGSAIDWGLVRAISFLNFITATLTCWRMSKGTRETEIEVDKSCNDHHYYNNREANGAREQLIDSSAYDSKGGEANNNKSSNSIFQPFGSAMKGSYKEALTKCKKEGIESKKGGKKYRKVNGIEGKTKERDYNEQEEGNSGASGSDDDKNEGNGDEDDILDLFDSAWLMNRGRNFEGNAPRSVSFHGGY